MANDFDCSIDYLVNEAMRYYARSKNYQSPGGPAVTGQQQTGGPVGGPNASGANSYPKPGMTGRSGGATQQPPLQPGAMGGNGMAARRPAPPTPGYAAPRTAAPSSVPMPHSQPPMPAMPPSGGMPPSMGSAGPTLFLIYNGQRYPVTKDQFIIGRGSKTSDLPIKDGNISRKHAAVIRRNGTFYIKDLGSTNGIDYKGMRIDNKRIDEGDVFHLCDYELRFTYRAD
jgi:pSer/pThr/pTyr-binding forkhead associated (FHA) protein